MAPRRSSRRTRGQRAGGGGGGGVEGGAGSVSGCLEACGVAAEALAESAGDLALQFRAVKKAYHKRVLEVHPDKGGDPARFREVRAAFETLKELFESGAVATFAEAAADGPASAATERMFRKYSDRSFSGGYTASWEFYEAAAQEQVPFYHVELARSNRSKCNCGKRFGKCPPGSKIDKGIPRVGSLDAEAGTYGRWVKLDCWRVPERIWRGLPNPDECHDPKIFAAAIRSMNEVLLTGFVELSPMDAEALVTHVMDPENWANGQKRLLAKIAEAKPAEKGKASKGGATKKTKVKSEVKAEPGQAPASKSEPGKAPAAKPAPKRKRGAEGVATKDGKKKKPAPAVPAAQPTSKKPTSTKTKKEGAKKEAAGALVVREAQKAAGNKFVRPTPGTGLAVADSLANETVVMTGVFPELGGGAGLSLGKAKARSMIESFGGRVTGSVSGKTTLLLVGKQPGASKVSTAERRGVRMIGLKDLADGLNMGRLPPPEESRVVITEFSAGYMGNGWGGRRLENLEKRLNTPKLT